MFIKTILQGRIEFGNEKSYSKVYKMFEYRTETYYKNNIIVEQEEVFNLELLSLEIPRYVGQHTEKSYRNTIDLLQYCAQFAISGEIRAWQTEKGTILKYAYIEPESDKVAVINFRKGKELVGSKGKEAEALEALTKAIDKYNRHAQAYGKRGEVNFMLKKYHDAERDFNKCLAIDDTIPDAYLGIANIAVLQKDYQKAIENLEKAIKKAIALQPIYWKSRRIKADCHIKLKEYEKAAFDLKFLTLRKFTSDNPNYKYKKQNFTKYGMVLIELEQYPEALDAFAEIEKIEDDSMPFDEGEFYVNRAIAKHKSGKSGYIKDFKMATELGVKRAATLLKESKKK